MMMTALLPGGSIALAAAATLLWIGGAAAQSMPDTENGRYTMSPITDGVMRLDTKTGEVSTCSNNGNGWACYAVPDERKALDAEIGRLQADNDRLKSQLEDRDSRVAGKTDEPLPKGDAQKPPEPKVADGERKIEIPRIEIPLPSDRDMDRAMAFLQNAWRRLVDMANRVQKDVNGRI
jgi:hypothetical protein